MPAIQPSAPPPEAVDVSPIGDSFPPIAAPDPFERELSGLDILAAQDLPTERVDVPEWGGHVYVRSMTAQERDAWELFLAASRGEDEQLNLRNVRATFVASTAVNGRGELLFSADQVEALGGKNAAAVDRIYTRARRLNRLSDDDVEDLAKNSPGGRSGSSPSASASSSASSTPTGSA